MKILGLDLSLTGTGVCLIEGTTPVLVTIRSKPPKDKTPLTEVKRIQGIVEEIEYFISNKGPIDIVVIEGMAFMARNTTSLVQLAGLSYMVRSLLANYNIKFLIVAPTSLKKFITGKGNTPKDVIMLEIFKRYDVSILDNNQADAYGLAQIGLGYMGKHKKKLTQPQEDVLKLLKTQ